LKVWQLRKAYFTARGGMTSHAAVVARGMGKSCVAGCEEIRVFEEKGYFTVKDIKVNRGDWITLTEVRARYIWARFLLLTQSFQEILEYFMKWVDEFRKLGVRANADTPKDSEVAFKIRGSRNWSLQNRAYVL